MLFFAEYMPGGSLYDYVHKNHNVLELSQLLKFAIDVCKGMEYLHQSNIIHRDLKTANLLMDTHNVRIYWKFETTNFLLYNITHTKMGVTLYGSIINEPDICYYLCLCVFLTNKFISVVIVWQIIHRFSE